ncbi:hypothetical protein D4764_13G0011670 [Takifugu flavidus]|uniref:Uncharacterized protein n=1 Tax=Takifugu flavidus TaxID=433684 RepID=A0A5C6PAV5_9TELE|nr:hypothetical protein D4764_13G0011670 [Takifugu flavidus]
MERKNSGKETTMLQAQILKLQQENLTLESENSTLKDVNKKQDHREQNKSRKQTLPSQSERNEMQTDNKLTGNKKGNPEMPARSQFRLPCKVIQVKPAEPVSKLLNQPAEPDKTSTAQPNSGEESETGGDTSQQQEDMRIWSIRPWLPSYSEGSELETHNKLDRNKQGKPVDVATSL